MPTEEKTFLEDLSVQVCLCFSWHFNCFLITTRYLFQPHSESCTDKKVIKILLCTIYCQSCYCKICKFPLKLIKNVFLKKTGSLFHWDCDSKRYLKALSFVVQYFSTSSVKWHTLKLVLKGLLNILIVFLKKCFHKVSWWQWCVMFNFFFKTEMTTFYEITLLQALCSFICFYRHCVHLFAFTDTLFIYLLLVFVFLCLDM